MHAVAAAQLDCAPRVPAQMNVLRIVAGIAAEEHSRHALRHQGAAERRGRAAAPVAAKQRVSGELPAQGPASPALRN
jgi:hypothetical protein